MELKARKRKRAGRRELKKEDIIIIVCMVLFMQAYKNPAAFPGFPLILLLYLVILKLTHTR